MICNWEHGRIAQLDPIRFWDLNVQIAPQFYRMGDVEGDGYRYPATTVVSVGHMDLVRYRTNNRLVALERNAAVAPDFNSVLVRTEFSLGLLFSKWCYCSVCCGV